jgi:cbb3-type cytochrome oxidase cytochrome c subunit
MAATDQNYRNQKTLDAVFGVSCVLMLASVVWMFAQDYLREWKTEQRAFRDVQVAMDERFALYRLPDPSELLRADRRVEEEGKRLEASRSELDRIDADLADLAPLVKADERARTIKADLDSMRSLRDIAVEKYGQNSATAQRYLEKIDNLAGQSQGAQAEVDRIKKNREDLLNRKADIEEPLARAKKQRQSLIDDFEIQAKSAVKDRWSFGDSFRSWPVIDAFNSPLRIHQIVLNDLPIDYNFKYVTRFDRCMTCHQGIDKLGYDKEALRALAHNPTDDRMSEARLRVQLVQMDYLDNLLRGLGKKPTKDQTDRLRAAAAELRRADLWLGNRSLATPLRDLGNQLDRLAGQANAEAVKLARARIANLKKNATLKTEVQRQQRYAARLNRLAETFGDLKRVDLSPERVNEFSVHPRLDLFVGPSSKHPAEKFGCTACHGGQGSATDFFFASHTPDDAVQKHHWARSPGDGGHSWSANHDWEFPMLPKRFVESGCLKCHYQVTDLIQHGNQVEAPKLVRGYNLVRENGCFGCHEIAGSKGGRMVGPDLRLEPAMLFGAAPTAEQTEVKGGDQPGTMRKVGPSLYRLSEKTHLSWVRKWIKGPREFRPTTRMPHFYNLSNNNPNSPDVQEQGQARFGDAEVDAIAHYLMYESAGYLENAGVARRLDYVFLADKFRKAFEKRYLYLDALTPRTGRQKAERDRLGRRLKDVQEMERWLNQRMPVDPAQRATWRKKELARLNAAVDRLLPGLDELLASEVLNEQEKKELKDAQERLGDRKIVKLSDRYDQSKGKTELPAKPTLLATGRRLFAEKGCLACHSHTGIAKAGEGLIPDPSNPDKVTKKTFAIDRDQFYKEEPAPFGPNLSMLAEKLGTDKADNPYEAKLRWLTQWIMDPTFHSPRTLMPITHLDFKEATAVATWLLDQEAQGMEPGWKKMTVAKSDRGTLEKLARLTLDKVISSDETETLFNGLYTHVRDLPADERELAEMLNIYKGTRIMEVRAKLEQARKAKKQESVKKLEDQLKIIKREPLPADVMVDSLKWYVGRKGIGRQGCFGCHSIPGFDFAKPIGTPLADWGKKDPDRIAFENIGAFLHKNYTVVDRKSDIKSDRDYERFFADALTHHAREGFLHQKLKEPRSYDYTRLRPWDERLRMPQFKFARTRQRPGEKAKAYQARAAREEAGAREAVMTFILGLVSEPIPEKFVNQPAVDRAAEVRGRQVLDKYNCASCHQLQPGIYEFKRTSQLFELLAMGIEANKEARKSDHFFYEHNAWKSSLPVDKDSVRVHGWYRVKTMTDPEDDAKTITQRSVLLNEAVAYTDDRGKPVDWRAYELLNLSGPRGETVPVTVHAQPWGGNFADLLVPYLMTVYKDLPDYTKPGSPDPEDNQYARQSGPPQLLREGERVQPNWLFGFLKDPIRLRPLARLRMPKFSLSNEEATALVNYFSASAKRNNPNIGLKYPYVHVADTDDYFADENRTYGERLRRYLGDRRNAEANDKRSKQMAPVWQGLLEAQVEEAKKAVRDADKALKEAKGDDKKEAQKALGRAVARRKAAEDKLKQKDYKEEQEEFLARSAFATDGFRLLTSRDLCLKCHQVMNLEPDQKQGPALEMAQGRLRPDYVRRWVGYPDRFLKNAIMPVNFAKDKDNQVFQELFVGDTDEQIKAARDALMNLRQLADMPANRIIARQAQTPGGP